VSFPEEHSLVNERYLLPAFMAGLRWNIVRKEMPCPEASEQGTLG
jgi:hypothetical protein